MSEVEKTMFRSENTVVLVGTLVSMDIQGMQSKKDNIPMYLGRMQIETAEGERHNIQVIEMKYWGRDKRENKGYDVITNLLDSAVTLESAKADEEASYLRVTASMNPNVYKSRAGEIVEGQQLQSRFIGFANRDEEPVSTITGTGVLATVPVMETGRDGEETGRATADVIMVDYRNIALTLNLTFPEDAVDWITSLEVGTTIRFQATIINRYLNQTVEIDNPEGYGKITEVQRDIKRETVVTGGQEIGFYEDYDEEENADRERILFPSQVTEAKQNYEQWSAEEIARADERKEASQKQKNNVSGFTKNKATGSKSKSKKSTDFNERDLPF